MKLGRNLLQPSSQNLPRGGIYSPQKITRKFDFRSACNKIPKTTAFTCILTLTSGISYMKSLFFCIPIEFTFSKRNLILQSGIYFFNSPSEQTNLHLHERFLCTAAPFLYLHPILYIRSVIQEKEHLLSNIPDPLS